MDLLVSEIILMSSIVGLLIVKHQCLAGEICLVLPDLLELLDLPRPFFLIVCFVIV